LKDRTIRRLGCATILGIFSMTTTVKREFWIHTTGMAYDFDVMSDSPTIRVISADWVDAEINKLKTELAFYKNGTQIKEIHYDEHLSIELAESKKQSLELIKLLQEYLGASSYPVFDDDRLRYMHVQIYKSLLQDTKDVLSKHKLKGN
jgi:hypothetical protein